MEKNRKYVYLHLAYDLRKSIITKIPNHKAGKYSRKILHKELNKKLFKDLQPIIGHRLHIQYDLHHQKKRSKTVSLFSSSNQNLVTYPKLIIQPKSSV